MRIGKTAAEKQLKKINKWAKFYIGTPCFALLPIKLVNGQTAWLETVTAKNDIDFAGFECYPYIYHDNFRYYPIDKPVKSTELSYEVYIDGRTGKQVTKEEFNALWVAGPSSGNLTNV